MENKLDNVRLIVGSSHPELGNEIARLLGIKPVECVLEKFANGECQVIIKESLRGKKIYILQTGCNFQDYSINDHLMQLYIIIDACKRADVAHITVIIPNLPYARQDKKDISGSPISASLVARMLGTMKINRIITIDLHAGQIQGFFNGACDNLYAINILCQYIKENIFNKLTKENIPNNFILVSPDNGGAKRIDSYSKKLELNNIIMHKQRDHSGKNIVTKTVLVGESDIKNKTAIIIDDMCDTMGTMVAAVNTLKEHEIKEVIVVATHGIFSGPALERINGCKDMTRVIVTNSLPQKENQEKCSKIEVVEIAPLLVDVIKRLETGESISELFK